MSMFGYASDLPEIKNLRLCVYLCERHAGGRGLYLSDNPLEGRGIWKAGKKLICQVFDCDDEAKYAVSLKVKDYE